MRRGSPTNRSWPGSSDMSAIAPSWMARASASRSRSGMSQTQSVPIEDTFEDGPGPPAHPQVVLLERRGGPEFRVFPGLLELQQLHQPLDVAQAAAAQFEVPCRVGPARQPLRFHPGLDAPDLAYVLFRYGFRVPDGIDQPEEISGQGIVAGHGPCPQQGLRLPDEGPAAVVLGEGVQ